MFWELVLDVQKLSLELNWIKPARASGGSRKWLFQESVPSPSPGVWHFWTPNKLTTWSTVLPEKLTDPQLLKKFPTFYGTRILIIACTRTRHLSLSKGSVRFRGLCVRFVTCLSFYGEELLPRRLTPKLEYHPLSAVRDWLFNILAATRHIWRPFLHPQSEDAPCRGNREPLITAFEHTAFQNCADV
jgi:hypothetical protein